MPEAKREKRSAVRRPVRLAVAAKDLSTGARDQAAQTRDLSDRGVFFFTTMPLVGSPIELVLTLPPDVTGSAPQLVCSTGRICRVERQLDGGGIGVAAVFERVEVLPQV